MSDSSPKKKSYKDTLNLPKTSLPIRSNLQERDSKILEQWKQDKVFEAADKVNAVSDSAFSFHDGPPYANGQLHMGHALNKILKDIVCKFRRKLGSRVVFRPGWDCHGLPIELKVAGEKGEKKESLSPVEFLGECRKYAKHWVGVHKEGFCKQGVLANWDTHYKTMDRDYEASILRALSKFVEQGHVERKMKTVPWCASCETALATAEIEYQDRKDPSIYVVFPSSTDEKVFSGLSGITKVGFMIWTTTPWTIPLNRAVVLHPKAKYVAVRGKEQDEAYVFGADLADKVCSEIGIEKEVIATFNSSELAGLQLSHPLVPEQKIPVILDDAVVLSDGTACLHSAPGCGPEDYMLGKKHGLEIYSPISADGRYTSEINVPELDGMPVADGQWAVLKKLNELKALVHKSSIKHSYPHCWRCRNGLIFRATDQWFCNLEKNDLVKRAMKASKDIEFFPAVSRARFEATVGSRTEWCISRQRMWGVPIPALVCNDCEHAFTSEKFVSWVADGVEKDGIEFWVRLSLDEVLSSPKCPGKKCDGCGSEKLRKETDILDVWFDSGVSNYAVLKKDGVFPSELYLEGSDQHRGWFQSSLLCSMVVNGEAPTKAILTHGHVLDAKHKKMSKSLGNGISPEEVISKYGADVLRLWVASSDFEDDMPLAEDALKNLSESYRKIRNTCRFMLANLYDFDYEKDAVEFEKLNPIDKFALRDLHKFNKNIWQNYKKYKFTQVFQEINTYCINELSALYLDIVKDRLYVEKADGLLRRSTQTVMYHILNVMTHIMSPVLSFASEEIIEHFKPESKTSIHLQKFPEVPEIWGEGDDEALGKLHELRKVVLKAIEDEREKGSVKLGLEASVLLFIDENSKEGASVFEFLKKSLDKSDVEKFLEEWCIVSQLQLKKDGATISDGELGWVKAGAEHAQGDKCPRCWKWEIRSAESKQGDLCSRCSRVVG
ncbi:isoleucine--tRNA ligase [bacterium]|nr:isoleucine--tRNA ligase [bacterium]